MIVPLQKVCVKTDPATGVGFTVMVNVCTGPEQPFAIAETVIIAVTGEVPALIAKKGAISPDPLAAKPMEGSEFVQLNELPPTALVKLTAFVDDPLHTTWG